MDFGSGTSSFFLSLIFNVFGIVILYHYFTSFYRSDWELFRAAVMFTLEEDGQMITLSHKKVSDKGIRDIQILENLQEDYQTFLSRW